MSATLKNIEDPRLTEILEVIFKFAAGDLTARGTLSDDDSAVDGVMAGINILGEELQAYVAENKKAQQALSESEALLRNVFDSVQDGIILADAQTRRFRLANASFCRMLGYHFDELINLGVDNIHPEEDLPNVVRQFERLASGEISLAPNLPMKRKDGTIFYADVNSGQMVVNGVDCLVGVFRDITERKRQDQVLRERNIELEKAKVAADAANQAKTRFLGTMSHELRTPMNAILGFSRLLHEQGLPAEQDVLAREIVAASEHLLVLLNGIIDYSRLEGGNGGTAEGAAFELSGMLVEASAAGFLTAQAKGLQTSLDIDPSLPTWVRGDTKIIQRVLEQFISNAVKFTVRGSIRLSAARLGAAADGQVRMRVSVCDTGIGIPREIQTRLFQPFMQADDGTDRKFAGIGLGLALARELAHLLGGEVGLASEPGQGSTFWLEFGLSVVESMSPATRSPQIDSSRLPPQNVQVPARASGPMPDNLRTTLQTLDKALCAYDTRAADVLTEAAPSLRPWLGGHVDTLAGLIDAFDYDQACILLKSLQTDASDGTRHER